MNDGQDVTGEVLDCHRALVGLYPHFLRVGLTIDSDEWQDVCEVLLRTLVLAPALGISPEEVGLPKGSYALWDPSERGVSILDVVPSEGTWLYVSDVVTSGRQADIQTNFRETTAEEIGPFKFREFADPICSQTETVVLDRVYGETVTARGPVRVAAPVGSVRYLLASTGR